MVPVSSHWDAHFAGANLHSANCVLDLFQLRKGHLVVALVLTTRSGNSSNLQGERLERKGREPSKISEPHSIAQLSLPDVWTKKATVQTNANYQ